MTAPETREDRVWGAGPFREIGQPRVIATSPDELIAIGGSLPPPRWHGHDASPRPRPDPGWHPVAVYRSTDLGCLHHLTRRAPANAIAFHPTLPLVAIGTGSYDGGWVHEGELLLLDLATGAAVSLLAQPREVRAIRWRDPCTLDLTLTIACDADEQVFGTTSLACSIRRDDWDRATVGMLRTPYGETPVPAGPPTDPAAAATDVRRLCGQRGLVWEPRGAVWAVHGLAGGRILTAVEGVGLECWSPASGRPVWRLPTDGTACQLRVPPGGDSALVLTQTPVRRAARGWTRDPSVLMEVDLDGGAVRGTREAPFPAVMVSRADGWWALRDTEHRVATATGKVTLLAPDNAHPITVALGRYDPRNYYFDIRYAPDLLFLEGQGTRPALKKWVVAVDPRQRRVRRLFPLEWDEARGGHLFGGCGAYLHDRAGPALVHAGTVHDGAGLLPGNAFVVRRAYPTGEPRWIYTCDHQATALDTDGERVYVALNSGELVILHAGDGSVRARFALRVNGHRTIPLSLALVGADRLAIGTLDGRVLDRSITALC